MDFKYGSRCIYCKEKPTLTVTLHVCPNDHGWIPPSDRDIQRLILHYVQNPQHRLIVQKMLEAKKESGKKRKLETSEEDL